MISGDITRRNVPGNAFRRAKARLIKKGIEAGLVSRGADATRDPDADGGEAGDQESGKATPSEAGGSSELKQDDEDKIGDGLIRGAHLRNHRLTRALSRVTEEDNMSIGSSFVTSARTFGGKDLESGDVSSLRSSTILHEGAEEETSTGTGGDGDTKDAWSSLSEDSIDGSADDSGRKIKTPSARRQTRSGPDRDKEASQSTGFVGSARGPNGDAHMADGSMNVWAGTKDQSDDDGNDSSPILLLPLRRSSKGRRIRASPTLARQRASRNISDGSSDVCGRLSEGVGAQSDSSPKEATPSGIDLAGPSSQASNGSGGWPKPVRKKEPSEQANESSGAGRPVPATLGRSTSPKADIVAHSSDEKKSSDPTTVASVGGSPSRSHGQQISKRHSTRSGTDTQSHSTTRKTRRRSSINRSSRDKATENLAGSPLNDVRTLSYSTTRGSIGGVASIQTLPTLCRWCEPISEKRKVLVCDAPINTGALSRMNDIRPRCFHRRI